MNCACLSSCFNELCVRKGSKKGQVYNNSFQMKARENQSPIPNTICKTSCSAQANGLPCIARVSGVETRASNSYGQVQLISSEKAFSISSAVLSESIS